MLNHLEYRIFNVRDIISSFLAFFSSPPAVAHRLRQNPSVAVLLQFLPSSPRSVPSASPRIPRECGCRCCGRAFCRRAIWENSGLQRDGLWSDWCSPFWACRLFLCRAGLENDDGRRIRLRRWLTRELCFADTAVDLPRSGMLHTRGCVRVNVKRRGCGHMP